MEVALALSEVSRCEASTSEDQAQPWVTFAYQTPEIYLRVRALAGCVVSSGSLVK